MLNKDVTIEFKQATQISASQAQTNKFCQQYTTPTFVTFGDCYDLFIYCSGNGVNRMDSCPKGTTFNKALCACSKTCGAGTTTSPLKLLPRTIHENSSESARNTL